MIKELSLSPGERVRFVSDIHFGHAKALVREPEELKFLLEGCTKSNTRFSISVRTAS